MKLLFKTIFIGVLFAFISCKDTKKAEAEAEQAAAEETVKQIESVETEIDDAVKEIEAKSEALENSLNELDEI